MAYTKCMKRRNITERVILEFTTEPVMESFLEYADYGE